MRSVIVIGLLAACGGAKPSADGPSHEAAAGPTPCPADAELTALAAEMWAPATDARDVWCVPVRVQAGRLWWIAGYANDAPHAALVEPPGNVIWKAAEPVDEMYPDAELQHAEDIDGDGTDEILYVSTYGEGGGSSTELVVIGVGGARPVTAKAALGWSSIDDEGCLSDWSITDGVVVVTGAGECATFSGRFRWNGTELVTE